MIRLFLFTTILAGVSPSHWLFLERVISEQRREGSGEPFVQAAALSDLNQDGIVDGVYVFSYQIGLNRDHTHSEFLSVVTSTSDGSFVASRPLLVGARGFRNFNEIEIIGQKIALRGDFTVSDGTASMADLPATGEIVFLFKDGTLIEQSGSWQRKAPQ